MVHQSQAQNFRGDSSPRETLAEQSPRAADGCRGQVLVLSEEKTVARKVPVESDRWPDLPFCSASPRCDNVSWHPRGVLCDLPANSQKRSQRVAVDSNRLWLVGPLWALWGQVRPSWADCVPGEISQFNWIISAFNLTSAAFIPFWGQIADIFGRHRAIQGAIFVMMVGSALLHGGAPRSPFPCCSWGAAFRAWVAPA